jgi:hypothetical protein
MNSLSLFKYWTSLRAGARRGILFARPFPNAARTARYAVFPWNVPYPEYCRIAAAKSNGFMGRVRASSV